MDAASLSFLVMLAVALFRWGFNEIKKKTWRRKTALAIAAMVASAGFFVWMLFFRTINTVASSAAYILLFRRSRR